MKRHPLQQVKQLLPAHGETALYGALIHEDDGSTREEVVARVAVTCWAWIDKPGRAEIVALVPEDSRPMLCRADDWSNFLRVDSCDVTGFGDRCWCCGAAMGERT